jgi:excisionase family DNA binding protein
MNFDEYLNMTEAAVYLGVTKQRVHTLAVQGRIGRQVAGHWLFTKAELDEYRSTRKPAGGRPKKRVD